MWVLETNLDDVPAEVIGYCFEQLFAAGALDVFTHADPDEEEPARRAAERAGAGSGAGGAGGDPVPRDGDVRRPPLCGATGSKLRREAMTVQTPWGPVKGKRVYVSRGAKPEFTPEYEECAASRASTTCRCATCIFGCRAT